MQRQKAKSSINEEEGLDFHLEEGEDPITRLGIGIMTYFDVIILIAKALLVMSIINIPLYLALRNYQVATDEFGGLTIGALG